ncbi:MAG TPA: sulfotransferase [Acidimicrobiales bacterium]|nr:sulfotransferase [Acidimicrobiales bacterium]
MPRIPNLFIVGAPKSGTTAMWSYLGKHPEIFVAGKEYHFFGSDLAYRNQQRPDSSHYLSHFDRATDERYLLDASIGYMVSKRAAAEIVSYSPDARIVAIVRNPIDMMHSLHSELLFQGDEDVADFGEALALEGARRRGEHIPEACQAVWALSYRTVAHYSEQLIRYFDALGRGRVHVVVFDDVVADTASCYQAVLEFLGVDPTFRPDLPVVNANKVARSSLMVRLLRSPPPFARRLGRMAVQNQNARRALGGRLQSLNAGRQSRPPVDPGLRRSLEAEFHSEVAALGELLGRDLSGWFSPVAQPS